MEVWMSPWYFLRSFGVAMSRTITAEERATGLPSFRIKRVLVN